MTFDISVSSDSSSPARPYLPRTQELEKLHYTVGARRSVADFRGLEPVLPPFFRPRSCTSLPVFRPLTGRAPDSPFRLCNHDCQHHRDRFSETTNGIGAGFYQMNSPFRRLSVKLQRPR